MTALHCHRGAWLQLLYPNPCLDSSLQGDATGGSSRNYLSEPLETRTHPTPCFPLPPVRSVIAKFKAVHMWTLNKCSLVMRSRLSGLPCTYSVPFRLRMPTATC